MRSLTAIVCVLVVVACSSNPPTQTASPSPAPSGAGPTASLPPTPDSSQCCPPTVQPTGGPTTPPATDGPTAGPVTEVPAGVQFGEPVNLPETSSWFGRPVVSPEGVVLFTGYRDGAKRGQVASYNAHALIGNPESGWQDVSMGGVDIANPPGFPAVRGGGAIPTSVALGENGYVAVGRAQFWTSNYFDGTSVGAIWHSADGLDWQLIDPRGLVGGGKLFTLDAVAAVPGGYVAAGGLADSSSRQASIEILGSADGVEWHVLSSIDGDWSLDPGRLIVDGDDLLLIGTQYACTDNSTHVATFGFGGQFHMWRSADRGVSWQEIDLAGSGVITQAEPTPTSKSDCPAQGPELNQRFGTQGDFLGVVDGQAVLISGPGDQVATSADLTTWTHYSLPSAVPEGDHEVAAVTVTSSAGGPLVQSLQHWRNPDNDLAQGSGWQTLVWQLPPGDGEAVRLPAGRPMILEQSADSRRLFEGPGGEVWLTENVHETVGHEQGATVLRRSVAGILDPWGSCALGPGADCKFMVMEVDSPGADLHGIDLRATRIRSGDLSGANLSDALLENATIYASLDNANLSNAQAVNADFYTSLTGANISGADFTGARVDATFLDAQRDNDTIAVDVVLWIEDGQSLEGYDLAGANLAGFSFHGKEVGNMRDVDFSGADVRNASFSSVDLTGADFSGAKLDSVYFGTEVTCPDGQPAGSDFGPDGCRLH